MGRKRKGRDISGWLLVDKPAGITSTAVVSEVKWALNANKAGHCGTLDPAATGVLAIALGEATKTVSYVTEALKCYRFLVRLGAATNTDDAEGEVIARSDLRPSDDEIKIALKRFIGDIEQIPQKFSAVKIDGERAYARARRGRDFELNARHLFKHTLELENHLHPIEIGLQKLPAGTCSQESAQRLRNGNPAPVILPDANYGGLCWVANKGHPIAIGEYRAGSLYPVRVFVLS